MNEKKGMIYLGAGLAILLIASLFIAQSSNSESGSTVIHINQYETTAEITKEHYTESAVTTVEKSSEEVNNESSVTEIEANERIWININTADSAEFMKLDGIGQVLADEIVKYRNSCGDFNNIEEIMLVNGIGEGIFNGICNNIYVDNPVYTLQSDTVTETIVTETETHTLQGMTLEEAAPIDLNTANIELLQLLPHVTEDIAKEIIELRDEIKYFSNGYELLYIDELEQNQVSEILEFVTVGQ